MENKPSTSDKTEISSNPYDIFEASDIVSSSEFESHGAQPFNPPGPRRAVDSNQSSGLSSLESDALIKSQARGNGRSSSYTPGTESLTDAMIKDRAMGVVGDPSLTPGAHPSLFVAMKQEVTASNAPSMLSLDPLDRKLSAERNSRYQDESQDSRIKAQAKGDLFVDEDDPANQKLKNLTERNSSEKTHDEYTSQNYSKSPNSELPKDGFLAETDPKLQNNPESGFASRPSEGNVHHQHPPVESSEQPSSANRLSSQDLEGNSGIEAFVADEQVVDALGVSILPSEEEIVQVENKLLRRYLICGIIALIILAVAIIVPVVIVFGNRSPPQPTFSPTAYPSASPSESPTSNRFAQVLEFVSRFSSADSLKNQSSPQYLAADWVANEDPIQTPLESFNMTQRYILAVFYFSTGGDNWEECSRSDACYVGFSWLTGDETECRWHGVRCTDKGLVEKILIGNQVPLGNNLVGTLPVELADLSELKSLVLIEGKVHSTIPSEYGKLLQLSTFFIQNHKLTGTIPDELLKGATSMDMFALAYNRLSGTIPTRLAEMPVLRDLQLHENMFEGTIPSVLGRLRKSLKNLELRANKLQGSIPDTIYNLTLLTQLSLSDNDLTGTISTLIGKMQDLEMIEFDNNTLTGEIPDALYSLNLMKRIRVGKNNLIGTISSKIEFLNDTLTEFSAEETLLTGAFPNDLALSLPKLNTLFLHGTKLTGEVSQEVCDSKKLNLTVPITVNCNAKKKCCSFQG